MPIHLHALLKGWKKYLSAVTPRLWIMHGEQATGSSFRGRNSAIEV